MGYNLFLDDIRTPEMVSLYILPVEHRNMYRLEKWEIARNFEEFKSLIFCKGIPSFVSFDHDLAEIHYEPSTWTEDFVYHEKTGLDCAKWLVRVCMDFDVDWFPEYRVHSQNPVGSKNILSYLKSYEKSKNK
jgi:hypothetical protein